MDQNETALLYLLKDKEEGRYPVTMIRAGLHSRNRQNLLVVNAHFGLLLIERVRAPLGGAGVSTGRTFKIAFSLAILSQL